MPQRGISTIRFLVVAVFIFVATSWAQTKPPIAEQIAKTYGLDSWGQIDAIRYTFNIPARNLSRTWTWEKKNDQVTYEGKDKDGKPVKVTYVRSQLSKQPENVQKEIDPGFVNDQYWLIVPFHLVWDSGADIQDKGMEKLPNGKGTARHVVVKYPSESGGYTPGDTWEFYVGKDNRIEYMVYHRGGPVKPSLVSVTWAGYKKAGPLLVSTDHQGTADGKPAQISFSNVAVKLAGSDNWVEAK
jgi:hypothetical protein